MHAQKIAELSLDAFIQAVLGHDQTVAERARELNIDVREILARAKVAVDKYGLSTGKSVGVARLNEAILEATSETVKGYFVSVRDRYGSNAPARLPLIRMNGNHMELLNWSGLVAKVGDEKTELQVPAKVSALVVQDREYRGVPQYRLVALGVYEPVTAAEVATKLNQVAIAAGQIGSVHENTVQVIRGKIAYVSPATKWEGKEKAGSYPLVCQNARDVPQDHPVFQIILKSENDLQVRAVFDRQKIATPTIAVEDLSELVRDAVAGSPSADDQARFIGDVLRDRDVLVVGYITRLNVAGSTVYVEVGASALFDVPAVGIQEVLPTSAPAASVATAPAAPVSRKDEIKQKVAALCEILDRSPAEFTPKEIKANWAQYASVADAVIEQALKELMATAAPTPVAG